MADAVQEHRTLIAGVELGGTKWVCILAAGPDDVREIVRLPISLASAIHGLNRRRI